MTRREMRESIYTQGKERPMILEVEGGFACVRPKGLRKRITVPLVAVWQSGVKAEVERAQRERRRRRRR